jgi:hypothetical protein
MLMNWTDILDGAIANAAWGVASMVVKPRTGRRAAADLDTAAWADTERLIKDALAGSAARAGIPDLPEEQIARLEAILKRHEVQGALQALLAARLTDAPEDDAAKEREVLATRIAGREAVRLALDMKTTTRPSGSTVSALEPDYIATQLSELCDDKISALVARLESHVGFAGLAQVRAEAYNARIVSLLGTIEQQVAALADQEHGGPGEVEFLERYRRQVRQRHGWIEPPDFDRRRLVPIESIYVPTGISDHDYPEQAQLSPQADGTLLNVPDLIRMLDRTVLLGDPGGGKTTAAKFIANRLASDPNARIPFVVTLREYAAQTPLRWSIVKHIEQTLETLHQSPAPGGLVERLLLTGRAVVLFDGLDELLDTSRRREVSARVEQFCTAYPLTPALVTSRVVGYDQARLREDQFTCYRLGGFGDREVGEYARKWFESQDGMLGDQAQKKTQAFLSESANARDLRTNPLLLSLMCILYRGAGSLPGDRAGVYTKCAELMLRKWDEQRDLYRKVRADHLIEPTIRHLAWWLFTRKNGLTEATERELVARTTDFLHERGYETKDEEKAAALEFIGFCCGRMWVFSDAGTTPEGEKLYAFTHRTFLEYFAARHLAASKDTPEDLATFLILPIGGGDWWLISELAIQVKDHSIDGGTDRFYATIIEKSAISKHFSPKQRTNHLLFLANCLDSAKPSHATVRRLTRMVLKNVSSPFSANIVSQTPGSKPLFSLVEHGRGYETVISDEICAKLEFLAADEPERWHATVQNILTFGRLFSQHWPDPGRQKFARRLGKAANIMGHHLIGNQHPPWILATSYNRWATSDSRIVMPIFISDDPLLMADEITNLGFIGIQCMAAELTFTAKPEEHHFKLLAEAGPLGSALVPYLECRLLGQAAGLSNLPVPSECFNLFERWAKRKISFVDLL